MSGFIVGVSGGIDSAVTSILCAETGKKVVLVNMPIRQNPKEFDLAQAHIDNVKNRYTNISSYELNLTSVFESFENILELAGTLQFGSKTILIGFFPFTNLVVS